MADAVDRGDAAATVAERYLLLGLRLGRHVDGLVDAYFGPAGLAQSAEAEPLTEPAALVAAAEALLDELGDGWLGDQVAGLRAYAGVLAGEQRSYADEVEACFGVRPTHTDESVFAAAHAQLDELLPGAGPLAERFQRWERSIRVPTKEIARLTEGVIEGTRAWTHRLVDLPDGEGVDLDIVRDEPWLAFCLYLGNLRSRISVNVDLPHSAIDVLGLVMHETYPGHHAERCLKEHALVRGGGLLEETLVMVPTPQSLVSEGIATLAPTMVLEGDDGPALAALTHDAGIELDLGHALAVGHARRPIEWANVNAALMLYEAGASEAEARAYVERWGLVTPQVSAHLIRFLNDPTSRTYVVTYPAGRALAERYVAGERERFRRLLTEQVRVGDLLAAAPPAG